MFEFVDEINHVLAERGAVDAIGIVSILIAGILRLQGKTEEMLERLQFFINMTNN